MRIIVSLVLVAVMQVALPNMALAAGPPLFGTFALFEVNGTWQSLPMEERRQGGEEAKTLLESFTPQCSLDGFWTYGLTTDSHFMLRLHSADLQTNQQFLTQLRRTGLGRHVSLAYTISGTVKDLNYASEFPDLLKKLKSATYEGEPPMYAIMIPVRKNAEWWNLSKEERLAMMKEHTLPTLDYLQTIKRKLYHSTGLSDVDFLTFFETNNLVEFNELVIALRKVREDLFNVQLGEPTIIGTRKSFEELIDLLVE